MQRPLRFAIALALLVTAAFVSTTSLATESAEAAPGGRATRYVAIAPIRVLDTRNVSTLTAGQTLTMSPIDAAVTAALASKGVDAENVEAVAINLTAINTVGPGFFTAFPAGTKQPGVSSLNNTGVNDVVPNLAMIALGVGDHISIFSSAGGDVTVDVQGVFERSTSSTAGRFVPIVPDRAIDTRDTTPVPANDSIVVDLTNQIPADASAAVLNIAVTETAGPGFVTVWEDGQPQPDPAANINYPTANYTVANSVITGASDGKVQVFSLASTDVIIDVVGYMTGEADPDGEGTEGLYVPLIPDRLWDSRAGQAPLGSPSIGANEVQTIPTNGELAVPAAGVIAVTMNLTMTNTLRPGFLEAYPAATTRPEPYSSVNAASAGQTVGNHAVVGVNNGAIDLFSSGGTDFIADVTGYFIDDTMTPPTSPPDEDFNPTRPEVPPVDDDFEFLFNFNINGADAPYERDGVDFFGWEPCSAITYATNVERATQVQIDAMNLAIRQAETATGIDFIYLGEVSGSLNTNNVDANVPGKGQAMAVIGFSDPSATPILSGFTIGIGGIGSGSGPALAVQPGSNVAYIVRGGFALADISDVTVPGEIIATLTHEIGHMIGLDHVNANDELMRPSLTAQTSYGNGDKNGLFNIGEPQCPAGAPLNNGTANAPSLEQPQYFDFTRWVADDSIG